MSRRPEANRAAQNQQTLKSLVKLESNKSCADCKKNKRTLESQCRVLLGGEADKCRKIHDGPAGIWESSSAFGVLNRDTLMRGESLTSWLDALVSTEEWELISAVSSL